MIKKVILKNFEAHEDSEIDFTDGLNLIIGQSNQGKSSIVRAIALVVANRFTKESVRTGADFCTVRIESDKGFVLTERGENRNYWQIGFPGGKTREYRNIGSSVPLEVLEVLGMAERSRGEVKELPNIMFQLEKHYMLSEIDGKKTTANMIARMMDDAIGIGGMEELIKNIATDFASKKKELGVTTDRISETRGKILDIAIFEGYQKSIEDARSLLTNAENSHTLLQEAASLSEQMQENRSRFTKIMDAIVCTEGLEQLDTSTRDAIKELQLLLQAKKTYTQLESVNHRLAFQLPELDQDLKELARQAERISSAEKTLEEARSLYKKIRKISNCFISEQEACKEAEKKFELLKKKLGRCPLCGSELK